MKWNIIDKSKDISEIEKVLLKNRGLSSAGKVRKFLHPPMPSTLPLSDLGIDKAHLEAVAARIKKAVKNSEPIIIYGDYDADGICATAILWETLRDLGAKTLPFIPQREKEGYGLSREGIDSIISDEKYGLVKRGGKTRGLIIAVDSGIVAHDAVKYAGSVGFSVIIIDHHEKAAKLPAASAILHTSLLCAAGISYFLGNRLLNIQLEKQNSRLELAAIATVTDLMPLYGPNRSIVKYGLETLNKTTRPGLRALFNIAGIEKISVYEIGYIIGPRINASGRIENALLALRLLCTSDFSKALTYAGQLDQTNQKRQEMMEDQTLKAVQLAEHTLQKTDRIIVLDSEIYHQGIIGLIAGKLVEKYYLPAIVISKGELLSKASARSISGFNIIEAIRTTNHLLVGAGGHPMAAGFTIETSRIAEFKTEINKFAEHNLTPDLLERGLRIDCHLELSHITNQLFERINQFAPFGIGNPEPTFASRAKIQSLRAVGKDGKHLKLNLIPVEMKSGIAPRIFGGIAFNQGGFLSKLSPGDEIQIAYTLDMNQYNGQKELQLKIKDIQNGGTD